MIIKGVGGRFVSTITFPTYAIHHVKFEILQSFVRSSSRLYNGPAC
jgi:hypothetical protein